MTKPNRPQLGASGLTAFGQWLWDYLIDPWFDDDGGLAIGPGDVLPEGGQPGEVLTKVGPDGSEVDWRTAVGEPGPPGLDWAGDWDAEVPYPMRSAVRHAGKAWYAVGDVAAGVEPGDDPSWVLLIEDARQVELRASSTHVQWRYEGDTVWTDLVALADLEGPPGPQGDTGPQGDPGPPGEFLNRWRGGWDLSESYFEGDLVTHGGSTYVAAADPDDTEPPSAPWQLVAQAGADGAGAVDSVNGQTGTVVLDAADVGAAPAADLADHVGDTGNPHQVTAVQVGADPAGSAAAVASDLDSHVADVSNPHEVTASQIGALPTAGGTLTSYSEAVVDHGVTSGTVTVDVAAGPVHVVEASGQLDVEFTGWPDAGSAGSVTLHVTAGEHAVVWPAQVVWPDGEPPELPEGRSKLVFDSIDGGVTVDGGYVGGGYA